MNRWSLLAASTLLMAHGLASAAPPEARSVTVVVSGVRQGGGKLFVDLCREKEFLTSNCYRSAERSVNSVGTQTFVFRDVAPAIYAAQALHDLNGNGQVDRDGYGAPAEPTAVSGKPQVAMRAPTFSEAAFSFDGKATTINVELR